MQKASTRDIPGGQCREIADAVAVPLTIAVAVEAGFAIEVEVEVAVAVEVEVEVEVEVAVEVAVEGAASVEVGSRLPHPTIAITKSARRKLDLSDLRLLPFASRRLFMTLVHASQRAAVRRAVPVECQVVRERDFKLVGRWGLDISSDGMLVVSDARVLTGEDVIVSFRVPRTHHWIDCEATVARVVHGRRPTDRARGLGLEFQTLDADTRWAIRSTLRSIPPPLPAREPRVDYAATIAMLALS